MRFSDRMLGSLFEHLGLKIASLLCALGLWAFLASQDLTERTVGVPFNPRRDVASQPPGTVVIPEGRAPLSVAVRLRGRRSRLRTLDEKALRVRLNLKGAPVGKVFSPPILVVAPLGFAVIDFDPVAVRVHLETVIQSERDER